MNALFEFYAALWLISRWTISNSTMQTTIVWLKSLKNSALVVRLFMTISKRTEKITGRLWNGEVHMYSDYIVRSQIFDQILERYPEDTFLQEQVEIFNKYWQSGVIMGSLVIYQGIPCKLLAARGTISYLDYRLSGLMISPKLCKWVLAVGDIQMKSWKKSHPKN